MNISNIIKRFELCLIPEQFYECIIFLHRFCKNKLMPIGFAQLKYGIVYLRYSQ
jgi:hypothetical protein